MSAIPSTKPYFIRALYDWCTDHGYTPYLAVVVDANTVVPQAYVHDGQITLNISDTATHNLLLGDDCITFQTRFNGVMEQIYVPVAAVAAIYARETHTGMGFEVTASEPESDPTGSDASPPASKIDGPGNAPGDTPPASTPARKSHLSLVK